MRLLVLLDVRLRADAAERFLTLGDGRGVRVQPLLSWYSPTTALRPLDSEARTNRFDLPWQLPQQELVVMLRTMCSNSASMVRTFSEVMV